MLPMTALSVISKHTWSGATPVRSRQSTTNSRNSGSPSVCAEMLIATLRSRRELERVARQRAERGLHHPSVHRRHEPVAFGRRHEFQRRNLGAGFVEHAQQDFHRRAVGIVAIGRNDGLVVQREAFFLERRLQFLQPLDLAGAARQRLVARRVHRHAARALFLRGVAGGIRGGEQLLDRACFAADLDEADRHADVEHAVVPDETIRGDRTAHVVGDLPRLVERTADQQHAELVAAEPRDRVRIAHRFAQQLGHFAQHAVAREMSAGVVDDLEAVEIEVTQHVRMPRRAARLRSLRRDVARTRGGSRGRSARRGSPGTTSADAGRAAR